MAIENPTPSPTPRPGPAPKPADIAVTLWPAPSIRVARGGALAYEIRVKNYGDGDAEAIRVTRNFCRYSGNSSSTGMSRSAPVGQLSTQARSS